MMEKSTSLSGDRPASRTVTPGFAEGSPTRGADSRSSLRDWLSARMMIFLRDTVTLPVNFGMGWLIIAHTVITAPYVVLTVSPRLKQLNPNLLEASMDLGAGPMRSLFTVMLPQLAGAMVSGFALAFTLSLDDFVITNINSFGANIDTISTFVYSGIRKKGYA